MQRRELEASCTSSILSYAILLGGVLTIAVALYIVVVCYSSLPYSDGWREVEVAANGNNPLSPAWLWQQVNEHRLVIPKLFLVADLRLFRARQTFLLGSIFIIQLLHWGLLSWSMWVLGGWRGVLWRSGTGLAAFCLFCPSQRQNFTWGFQVCFVLPQLFATLSFVALLLYWTRSQEQPDKSSSELLAVSVLAALGATYSLASGSLLWPLLITAALYLRLRVSAVLGLAIAGAVSTLSYLYHYARPQALADPFVSLRTPLPLIEYWVVYFLSSWSHPSMHVLESIALLGMAIVATLLLPPSSFVRNFRPFAIQLALTIAFCLGTGLITAAGRVNIGVKQAFASRYQSVALLFWCCLGLLWLGAMFFSHSRTSSSFLIAQICVLIIFGRGAVLAKYPIAEARRVAFTQRALAAALVTGIYDPVTLSAPYPQMDLLLRTVPYMKANRLSVFSDNTGSELGRRLQAVFPVVSFDDCAGELESIVPIGGPSGQGLRILGRVWDSRHRRGVSSIIVTTDGIITGLGAAGELRSDVKAKYPRISSDYSGFVAFAPKPRPGSILNVYASLRSNPPTACYLPAKQ